MQPAVGSGRVALPGWGRLDGEDGTFPVGNQLLDFATPRIRGCLARSLTAELIGILGVGAALTGLILTAALRVLDCRLARLAGIISPG